MYGPIKLVLLQHFLLKCLYQAGKVKGHVYMCVRSIDFACFYNFVTTYGGKLATMIERTMEKRHIIKSGFGL